MLQGNPVVFRRLHGYLYIEIYRKNVATRYYINDSLSRNTALIKFNIAAFTFIVQIYTGDILKSRNYTLSKYCRNTCISDFLNCDIDKHCFAFTGKLSHNRASL